MTKIICDVCGETIDTSITIKPRYRIENYNPINNGSGLKYGHFYKSLDLCDNCQKKIDKFFDELLGEE